MLRSHEDDVAVMLPQTMSRARESYWNIFLYLINSAFAFITGYISHPKLLQLTVRVQEDGHIIIYSYI